MTVYVLHPDIDRAVRGVALSSPVERAIRRQTGYWAEVRGDHVALLRNGTRSLIRLPAEAVEAVRRWDQVGVLTPFCFELPVEVPHG